MRISKIFIPESQTSGVGLKEINLTKKNIGAVVALFGKNGAGKTRVLDFVGKYPLSLSPPEKIIFNYLTNIPVELAPTNYEGLISGAKNQYNASLNMSYTEKERDLRYKSANDIITNSLVNYNKNVQKYVKTINPNDLATIKQSFSNDLTFEQILDNQHTIPLQNNSRPILNNELNFFSNKAVVDYFSNLSSQTAIEQFNLYINLKNHEQVEDGIREKEPYILFQKFKNFVKKFLDKELSYKTVTRGANIQSALLLDNKNFVLDNLSPGEKTLFAYAVMLFYLDVNTKANIKDCILIIDEPEKHLHPSAQIKLIQALRSIIEESGQLWIATHSVHILSHLETEEIFMVKNNEIFEPSRMTPGNSMNELMELDLHIDKLLSFMNASSHWAYGNFMAQCFKDPDVIFGANQNDPQYKLLKEHLLKSSSVKLLDFGAGHGRIGSVIVEDGELQARIQYSAFEPNRDFFSDLNRVTSPNRIFDLIDNIEDNYYDCILLCGVLHEINPKEWVTIMNKIKRALHDGGSLIIIEDKYLPKGENAHEFGYLILNIEQLRILFNLDNDTEVFSTKLNQLDENERLTFFCISKNQISVSNESVLNAIKSLECYSFQKLRELRTVENKDIDHGRKYANQTQIYINSQLALDSLNIQ